jgi:aminoglycoside phosphotransferase (APT) family kinase protein
VELAPIRARQVLRAIGRSADGLARVRTGRDDVGNEVWFIGDEVLRINPRPQTGRLAHEMRVAELLGPQTGYPGVVTAGNTGSAEWVIMRRVPGEPLARVWRDLRFFDRESAAKQFAHRLRACHETPLTAAAAVQLTRPFSSAFTDPHPADHSQLLELREAFERRQVRDRGLVHAALTTIERLRPAFDGSQKVLVHGDPHFENVMWHDGSVTALLDMEFARPAWREVDLEVMLRFFDCPQAHVASDLVGRVSRDDYREVQGWVAEAYPELFAGPRLLDRLTVLTAAADLRALAQVNPNAPETEWHPARRLRRLLDGRHTLTALAW